jgi:hypothetical protein
MNQVMKSLLKFHNHVYEDNAESLLFFCTAEALHWILKLGVNLFQINVLDSFVSDLLSRCSNRRHPNREIEEMDNDLSENQTA